MENTILFCGCDTQVGTTMVALSAAELLAEEGYKVLYISAGPIPGNPFLETEPAGAAADLWGGTFGEEEIRQLVTKSNGVDIMQGIRSWMNSGSAMTGLLEDVCRICSRIWDYVIVDGGSCGDGGMGREALSFSCKVFLVLTQQEKTLYRWRMRREWLEQKLQAETCFLVNKFVESRTFYTERQLLKILQCEEGQLVFLPYLPYGWQAEAERCTLMKYRRFQKAMEKTAEKIKEDKEKECDTAER